jgi:hypothetical protein
MAQHLLFELVAMIASIGLARDCRAELNVGEPGNEKGPGSAIRLEPNPGVQAQQVGQ